MLIDENQEVQKSVKEYVITLLSDENITLKYIQCEDISENRDGYTNISMNSATYNQRLYDAFKNKELIQCIVKRSINIDVDDSSQKLIDREFIFDNYFTINEFSVSTSIHDCGTYAIEFQSV